MTDYYTYQRKRKEFGRPPTFLDTDTQILGTIKQYSNRRDGFILRDPNKIILDNIPVFSEHSVSPRAMLKLSGKHGKSSNQQPRHEACRRRYGSLGKFR